jgi:hypothetical protein
MEVVLPIYYFEDGQSVARIIRRQTFYVIESTVAQGEDTLLYSGGQPFVCKLPEARVKDLIRKANKYSFTN